MNALHLELTTLADDDRPVFVSGNFCDWIPDHGDFRMQKKGPGRYFLQFPAELLAAGEPPVYKYTRGSWDSVELGPAGERTPNRELPRQAGTRQDLVPHWRWFGRPFNPELLPKIEMVDEAFALPQLKTTRRVQVLLPYDYEASDKRYPVLYLHDAQNLFGEGSPFGNWDIDQKLAILAHRGHHAVIIVAIDHGEEARIAEYSPYKTRQFDGLGRPYVDFIVQTLKPHIDAGYRTLTGREQTGLGGSSMGGLITTYAGFWYPEVFGRLMVFSPSYWAAHRVYAEAARYFVPGPTRLYLYGGKMESAYLVPNLKRLQESLWQRGPERVRPEIKLEVDAQGEHNEARWSLEFPKAVEWLFFH
ncbi:alpha/beta hydrolase [Larkinella soli]|uniref:alpha/beta hydrolase n=1 Tax=Larkinella soli TaxID=1770527 RepID=UPI000FFBD560|nr:alpha/beta hydrolase-fold protein [Larkinella soli]